MTIPFRDDAAQPATSYHSMKRAALDYARAGWFIFPVRPFGKRPLRGSHGFLDATRDPARIAAWWDDSPWANVAVDCGRSGLLVVDIDPRNGGDVTWGLWTAQHTLPPATRTSRTPGGGTHYFYDVSAFAVAPKRCKLGPGVDIQAAGSYVILPPSETLQGRYQWD